MPPSSTTNHNSRGRQSTRPHTQRNRSASDPFVDPIYTPPYQPHLDDKQPRSAPLTAPQPPPKSSSKKHRSYTRDPVMMETTVRDQTTIRPVDPSPRTKMGRSHTGGVPTTASGSKASPTSSRRSYSQDSVSQSATMAEKARRSGKSSKKGSTHADVIDRLDFTGVGPMFHHDGPFDACMPSRNRHKTKAPMLAWTGQQHDEREDPSSAAQFRAAAARRGPVYDNLGSSHYDSPYPNVSHPESDNLYQPPKKQVDRIAEAWGIHEPEPYEEFFAGGGARPNGETGLASAASSIHGGESRRREREREREAREIREHLDEARHKQSKRNTRTNMPPPQPIFVGNAPTDGHPQSLPSPGLQAPGTPKRSKSLMQKFRKMRDAPNVPPGDVEEEGSPPSSLENYSAPPEGRSSRPTHRQQNSFFGRFRGQSATRGPTSPTKETYGKVAHVEEAKRNNKALPPRPSEMLREEDNGGYFEAPVSPGGTAVTPGAELGRKTSLMKKVKGVVRSAGNK